MVRCSQSANPRNAVVAGKESESLVLWGGFILLIYYYMNDKGKPLQITEQDILKWCYASFPRWWITDRRSKLKQCLPEMAKSFNQEDYSLEEFAIVMAQLTHESGGFWYLVEQKSDAWCERNYGRHSRVGKKLGNVNSGDGAKFKGRGVIQLTGRKNYTEFQEATGIQCVDNPQLIEEPENAVKAAFWYLRTYVVSDTKRTPRQIAQDSTLSPSQKMRRVTGSILAGEEHITDATLAKGHGDKREKYTKWFFNAVGLTYA